MTSPVTHELNFQAELHQALADSSKRLSVAREAELRPVTVLPQSRLMSSKDAAEHMGMSNTTFQVLVSAGTVSRVHFDGVTFAKYDRQELDALIEASKQTAPA